MLKVWWVSVKSGFGESLRISCAFGDQQCPDQPGTGTHSSACFGWVDTAQGRKDGRTVQVSLELKPLMAYSARSVSLSAYSTFLTAFEKASPVISVWSVLCKQEGTREGNTAWHLLWDFSPCISFQLWYEVGCACCSCAFEASRIAVCETCWHCLSLYFHMCVNVYSV